MTQRAQIRRRINLRSHTRRFVLLAVVVTLFALAAHAQAPALYTRWENFTTANGMPDEKVFCVAVDGNRIWAGTEMV